MKVLSFMLMCVLVYLFMSASIHLTKTNQAMKPEIIAFENNVKKEIVNKKIEKIRKEKIYRQRINKIVKSINLINPNVEKDEAIRIAKAFIKYGKQYKIRINHLLRIASVESRIDPDRINKESKDYGLMQINWRVWGRRFAKHPKELLNIEKNVQSACYIIQYNRTIGFKDLRYYHSFTEDIAEDYGERLAMYDNKFHWSY